MNDKHSVKVGDIFLMSWGYDQTNVNWFQVTRVSKGGIFIREINAVSVPGSGGFMCDRVMPAKDQFLTSSQWCSEKGQAFSSNVETFRRVSVGSDGNPYFNIRGRYFAFPWKGVDTYRSWYA